MAKLIKMAGTVRSVNGVEPDENANVTVPQISILQAYPVGSIYMSVVGTNPAELFGGTWVPIASGRVLLGADEHLSNPRYTAGTTGGSISKRLTSSNIPSHNHSINIEYDNGAHSHLNGVYDEIPAGSGPHSTNYGAAIKNPTGAQHVMSADSSVFNSSSNLYMGYTSSALSTHTHSATIGYYGQTTPDAISLMQPFLVVYMWKRTA